VTSTLYQKATKGEIEGNKRILGGNKRIRSKIDGPESIKRNHAVSHQKPTQKAASTHQIILLDPITDDPFKKLKGKNWCFTLAHPNLEEMNRIKTKIEEENEKFRRAVVGIERGKTDEFEHLQGSLSFDNNDCGWQLKRISSDRADWEKVKGNPKQTYDYWSKGNNLLAIKEFEQIIERETEEKETKQSWVTVRQGAMNLTANAFANKHPKEWILRRTAIERMMLEAAKKKVKAWNGL
jgi:hypothetical protein